MRPLSLRMRLTAHHTGVLAVALALQAGALCLVLRRHAYGELDHRLQEDVELAARLAEPGPDGRPHWKYGGHFALIEEEEGGGHWVEVWGARGERLLSAATAYSMDLGTAPTPDEIGAAARTVGGAAGPLRTLTRRVRVGGEAVLIRVAISEGPVRHHLRDLLLRLAALFPAVLAVAAIGGSLIARRALAPLSRMAALAQRISADRLSDRIPEGAAEDETSRLARAFNVAFARLERSFEQLRGFSADVSHELRTPLTALRSVGEVGLVPGRPPEAYREVIASMLEEAERLTRLVDALLTLSRAEAGQIALRPEPLDIGALAQEVAGRLSVLAEERGQSIAMDVSPAPVRADRLMLRQALMNLVDNAIKYSPEGASIRVGAATNGGTVRLEIEDNGPGIASEHSQRVFDRFYRVDRGRSRESGGAGLGLALARWAVEASGGRIELESEPGRGSVFRIVLPSAAPPKDPAPRR